MSDIAKEVKKCSISFNKNTQLETMLKEPNLGKLKTSETHLEVRAQPSASDTSDIHSDILDKKLASSNKINVKLPGDDKTPDINGCAFLANGKLLLMDGANRNIKLLDSSFAVEDNFVLSARPLDIAAVDDGTAIVALPDEPMLQYVHMIPKLDLGRTLSFDGECYSVVVVNDDLFVCCCEGDKGDIRIVDKDGKEKRRIDVKKGFFGSRLFKWPRYIISNVLHTKIFVSDKSTDRVTCLTTDGKIIYQYKDESMRPRGLYVDAEDNLLVCSYYEDNIQVITAEGKKYKTLLTIEDGLEGPKSIVFRPRENIFVVGCWNTENLLIFQQA